MDRQTALWALVAFFGSAIAFNAVQRATEDSAKGVTIIAQLGVLAVIVVVILVIVRRRSGPGE